MHHILSHNAGLTETPATFFLLLFALCGNPRVNLKLLPGHSLVLDDGRTLQGNNLSREYLPMFPWQGQDLRGSIDRLVAPESPISWNEALEYSGLFCQGLSEVEGPESDYSSQEMELLAALRGHASDVRWAEKIVERLTASIQDIPDQELVAGLRRLDSAVGATNFRDMFQRVAETYPDARKLIAEMEGVQKILSLGRLQTDIENAVEYLRESATEGGPSGLALDRLALLERVCLSNLLAPSQGWTVLAEHILEYRRNYCRTCLEGHDAYQRDVVAAAGSLQESRRKLETLVLLNSIVELGAPIGEALEQRLDSLEASMARCEYLGLSEALEDSPICPGCRMQFGDRAPSSDVEAYRRELDRDLVDQNRRLGRMVVRRIVQGLVDSRIEDFLKVVLASDLSGLSNTMDTQLAEFIRGILRDK